MLDWLIVGGGMHGTIASRFLTGPGEVLSDRIRVLDPFERPLASWDHVTRNTGMEFMRSPSVHSMDVAPFSVRRFAKSADRPRLPSPITDLTWPCCMHRTIVNAKIGRT